MSALSELLSLPGSEKAARGLEHTPAEIAQQPETWLSTFEVFRKKREQIAEFLALAGIGASPRPRPTVFLIGAGTSDYIGQSLTLPSSAVLELRSDGGAEHGSADAYG